LLCQAGNKKLKLAMVLKIYTDEDHDSPLLPIAGGRCRRLPLAVIRAPWPSDKHRPVKIFTAGELAPTPPAVHICPPPPPALRLERISSPENRRFPASRRMVLLSTATP
jgi:hypothetical protein